MLSPPAPVPLSQHKTRSADAKAILRRSGVYSRGIARAFIDLDPQSEREYNLHHLYPAMVAACLVLQILTYVLMHRVMKPGGIVFRPREEEKMEQYRVIHGLTGSPDTEMTGRATGRKGAGVRRESEAAPLLLPPPAMDSRYASSTSIGMA
jgi:hypothetical protein